jgi:hypothetical protein
MPREEIGDAIRRFVDKDDAPVFWGYFSAFDWVRVTPPSRGPVTTLSLMHGGHATRPSVPR